MIKRVAVAWLLAWAGCGSTDPLASGGSGTPDLALSPGGDGGITCPIHSRRPERASRWHADDVSIQRGVDRAGVFSTGEAATLATDEGVTWTGVYIGGACNAGSGWTPDALTALHAAAGWSFLPIYVGQQSAAICQASDLSYDSGVSDGKDAAGILVTYDWAPNTMIPVALDVEAGTFSANAVGTTDYVHGWLDAIHAAGYLGYVYSSPSALDSFAAAPLPIDAAWAASYFYSDFADVSPSDLTQLGTNFADHDRAWQYAGNVSVSGAGRVDCDSADLLLAPPPGGSNQTGPAPAPPPPPTGCASIAQAQGFVAGESVYSCNCSYTLALTSAGDLVLSSSQGPIWSANIAGKGGAVAVMQSDGNFVVYSSTSAPVGATGTDGHPGAVLSVQDDGNLVVYDAGGAVLWASNS